LDFDLDRSCAVLERTPAVARTLLGGLPPEWTSSNEGADSWSAFDIVGHLIDGEETDWIPRARIILAHGPDRRFTPFDRLRHLQLNRGRRLDDLIERFAALRGANLKTLRAFRLTPAKLTLTGGHPEFGVVTLRQLLAAWVVHDLGHLAQIARVMAKQYREPVGPWEAYLPVLHR